MIRARKRSYSPPRSLFWTSPTECISGTEKPARWPATRILSQALGAKPTPKSFSVSSERPRAARYSRALPASFDSQR